MAREKLRQHRELIARARVVFHRARPERIKVRIDRKVAPRQIRVMAHRVEFGHFRQQRRRRAAQRRGDGVGRGRARGICDALRRCGCDNSNISTARPRQRSDHRHGLAVNAPHRYLRHVDAVEAVNVHAVVVGGGALAVKRIDAARAAKIMLRNARVPPVQGELVLALAGSSGPIRALCT